MAIFFLSLDLCHGQYVTLQQVILLISHTKQHLQTHTDAYKGQYTSHLSLPKGVLITGSQRLFKSNHGKVFKPIRKSRFSVVRTRFALILQFPIFIVSYCVCKHKAASILFLILKFFSQYCKTLLRFSKCVNKSILRLKMLLSAMNQGLSTTHISSVWGLT